MNGIKRAIMILKKMAGMADIGNMPREVILYPIKTLMVIIIGVLMK